MNTSRSPHRVGIVGAGQVVENSHLPVLSNIPNVNIVWITDKDAQRAQRLSKMYSVLAISPTEAMLQIENVDVCLLAIPVGTRQNYLERCAQTSTAIYVEKPFARSSEEHGAILRLFPEYAVAVGFQRRFLGWVGIMKDIIDHQLFGNLRRILFVQAQYELKSGGAERFITDARLSGGGIVIESAIHGLDQILYITGASSVSVEHVRSVAIEGIEYDVVLNSTLYKDESCIPVECVISRLRSLVSGFVFVFDRMRLRVSLAPDANVTMLYDKTGISRSLVLSASNRSAHEFSAVTINQAFYTCWSDFLDSLHLQKPSITAGSRISLTTHWVEEIYKRI